ncbi:hypothetical protein H5410_058843, partial [Solanum commersonii]
NGLIDVSLYMQNLIWVLLFMVSFALLLLCFFFGFWTGTIKEAG